MHLRQHRICRYGVITPPNGAASRLMAWGADGGPLGMSLDLDQLMDMRITRDK